MAEEEVNYASVVFKTSNHSPPEAKREDETVYDEVKVRSETTKQTAETTKQTADTNVSAGSLPDKEANSRRRRYQQVACCLGILCVILLLGIVAVGVYLATLSDESEQNQLKENQTILLAVNRNLTNLNNELRSENENLRRDRNNLTVHFDNLTRAYAVLESKITNLTAENQNLTTRNQELNTRNQELNTRNQELNTRNQELVTQKNNLTEQIQSMVTQWNKLNVSRAQWSIDAYCPKVNQNRQCQACQGGWETFLPSCYAINNAKPDDQKTWEEARENCTGKISDLVVINNQTEKTFISGKSWSGTGITGYWIGLRVEDGRWKWVDGSDLTENSWIQQPPVSGQCAISVPNQGWKPVSCGDRNAWICEKNALSV